MLSSFHSLPTGKRIGTWGQLLKKTIVFCFNSLPTGKRRGTGSLSPSRSISISFHSLPTGKRIGTNLLRRTGRSDYWVSIPYQRESAGEPQGTMRQAFKFALFQFPTNGKAQGNECPCRQDVANYPRSFNSLPTGKRMGTGNRITDGNGNYMFQFPTNGKALLNTLHLPHKIQGCNMFQFPTNGKALLNFAYCALRNGEVTFQFPTNGKALLNVSRRQRGSSCVRAFQFPTNGKALLNAVSQPLRQRYGEWFQFPTNGKALLNTLLLMPRTKLPQPRTRFNSLRTGKHF